MRNNAKRVLSFVLVLLMSLSMLTGIVLPAAAGTDASDPYAKITGTKDGVVITPDANVYFFNPTWATAPTVDANGQFEYTYGDGSTWGNGKTYLLTWNKNAFAKTGDLLTVMQNHATAWKNDTTKVSRDMVLVLAPGTYGNWGYAKLAALADDPTAEQVANVYWLGPQAGKNPVSADKSTKAAAKAIQNGRSVSTTTEAVFNALFPLVQKANFTVDGIAGTGAFCFYSRNDVGNICHFNVKNMYVDGMTDGFNTSAIFCGYSSSLNTSWELADCYFNLDDAMKGTANENNNFYSNKVVFDNCVFAGGKFSKLNPASNTHQTWFLPQDPATVSSNFMGEYKTNPLFEIKNCTVVDFESSTLFRFLVNNGLYQKYTNYAVKIKVHDNAFYDAGTYNGLSAPIFFNSGVSTDAIAKSFEARVENNLFSFSDEIFDQGKTGTMSCAININNPSNKNAKYIIKGNVFKAPNNKTVHFANGFAASEPQVDASGNLFMDNQGNILPLSINGNAPKDFKQTWNVQSDIYASDAMKGGVRELMTVTEVENGAVLYSFIQTRRNSAKYDFDYLTGALTLLLKDGVEYDADTLIKTSCEDVKFLGIYSEEACTTKVDKITQATINGKFAKLQYKTATSTCTVVYALNTPRNYLIVDTESKYTTDGYAFNGKTYKPDTATDGVYAKFYATLELAYEAATTPVVADLLNLSDADQVMTDKDGNEYAVTNNLNDLIVLTPGTHTIVGYTGNPNAIGTRKSFALVGPQWGVSPYGAANANGNLANGRGDAAKEATVEGAFTVAADSGPLSASFNGVTFGGGTTSVNLSHASSMTGSQYQFIIVEDCVFNGTNNVLLGKEQAATNNKVLDVTIQDCAFDVSAQERTAYPLVLARANFADVNNVAVLTDKCIEEDAWVKFDNTDASAMGWTTKLAGHNINNVTLYAPVHSADLVVDDKTSTANCFTGGTATASCSVCGKTETVEVAATGKHDFDTTKWVQGETTHYHACKTVGCTAKDAETAHVESEVKIDTPAGCTSNGKGHTECTVCGKVINNNVVIPSDGKHNIDTSKWVTDGNGHWHACTSAGCTEKADYADHTESELIIDQAPTELTAGSAHSECTVCKKVIKENVVLPATNQELADRFAAITAVDSDQDGVLEPQGVVFVDPAFGKDNYVGTFEYTYGDGETFGNGATYELTVGVNAYAKMVDAVLAVQAAWNAADTTVADYTGIDTVVIAPGEYSWDNWQPNKSVIYDLPTDFVKGNAYDKLFTVNFIGPQAGLSPVTDEIDHADPAAQNGRSDDPTKEAVSTGTMWEPRNAYYIVDGMAFAKSHNYFGGYDENAPYTALTVKNVYHHVNEFYAGGVFRFGNWNDNGFKQNRYLEFKDYYIEYETLTDPAKKAQSPTGEFIGGNMIIFDNFYEDMTDVEYVTDQYAQAYQKNTSLNPTKYIVEGFAGEGVTGAHLIFKNSTLNNHATAHFMRFKLNHADYETAAQDSINIRFENNLFYNAGDGVRTTFADGNAFANDPAAIADPGNYTDIISFQDDWQFPATSGALDFDFVGNTIEYTKAGMSDDYDGQGGTKMKTAGGNIFNITDNNWTDLASYAMENLTQVKHGWDIRDTKMIIPTHSLASKLYLTPTVGKASTAQTLAKINDSSSVLVLNENNEVCTWYVSNQLVMDVYASDTFAGGVKELFGVMNGADMAIADWRITVQKSMNPDYPNDSTKWHTPTPGFEGRIMIVPEVNADSHNPEDLFNFRGESVEFVELLDVNGNKVTGKVNPNDLDGYKVKARVLGNKSVCNVTYTITIAPESEYVFIDPTNSVTSYTFNGKTYTLNETNRFAKFDGALSDKLAGGSNAPADNLPNVVVYLPGTHAFQNNQIKANVAILGPGFGKDLMNEDFTLTNKRGITKTAENAYTVDTTKEAVISGGAITVYRNEVSCFVDGLVFQNGAQIQLMNINSYWWAASGSMHAVTLKNSFLNGLTKVFITGFDNSARNSTRLIEKDFVCLDEVFVAGKGVTDSKVMIVNAAAINTDVNRLYVENLGTNGMIRVGANNGLQMMNHPGTVYFKLTNSKIKGVTENWNMIYPNFVDFFKTCSAGKNDGWGSTPEASNPKAFPGGFKVVIDGNVFENNTAPKYLIRTGTHTADAEIYTTNNIFINNTSSGDAKQYYSYTPTIMTQVKTNVIENNLFINEPNGGIYNTQYADLNENKTDISNNYFATNDGTKDTVQLITPTLAKNTYKSDWYYLDRAMTVKNTDVALVDNGYKVFEDKGFDGINNFVIDASESDLENLFKAAEGATIEGIYSDAACTQATTAVSGTVYVKVAKNGISLANKVELTACDHNNTGTREVITLEPTCCDDGTKDVVCAACGTAIQKNVKVPATGEHSWEDTLTMGENTHWYACKGTGCTAKKDESNHTKTTTPIVDEMPGCATAGKGHHECTACGKVMEENVVIPSTGNHAAKDELVVDKAPSCYETGIGHSICKDCSTIIETNITIEATGNHEWNTEWVKGENTHYHTCKTAGCPFKGAETNHTAGELIVDQAPSCYENGVGHKNCTVCEKTVESNIVIEATGNHDWNTGWVQGTDTHYHTCKTEGCPAKGSENAHTKKLITLIPETCGAEGLGKYVCATCDKLLEENVVIAPTGKHTAGEIEIYEGLAPDCGNEGLGHKDCTVCGQTVTDNIILPTVGEHVAGELVIDKAATCTENGKGHIDCAVCGTSLEANAVMPAAHTPGAWVSLQPGKEALHCAVCGVIIELRDTLPEGSDPVDVVDRFVDVDDNDWYAGAVEFVVSEGLFEGTSSTKFSPDANMTRAMFVTVLGRLHGVKQTKASTQFSDVKKSAYYSGYVAWAAKNGIVNGVTDTSFAPDANITREQICVMMVRYMNYAKISAKKINSKITFKDASSISSYAKSAVATCQTGGIISGIKVSGGYKFAPKDNATRAQVATIMKNFCELYK